MILPFFGKPRRTAHIEAVYNAIVAQSRHPVFYAEWNVADSVTGRFNMISLHLALVLRRLRHQGKAADRFGQKLFDHFFKDMDHSLIELGVSEASVPKRIQKMSALFYGMLAKLTEALDEDDAGALQDAIRRNIYDDVEQPGLTDLCAYTGEWTARLDAIETEAILKGELPAGMSE